MKPIFGGGTEAEPRRVFLVLVACLTVHGCGVGSSSNDDNNALLADLSTVDGSEPMTPRTEGTINVFTDGSGGAAGVGSNPSSNDNENEANAEQGESPRDDPSEPADNAGRGESTSTVNMTPTEPNEADGSGMAGNSPPAESDGMASADPSGCFVRDFPIAREQFMEADDGSYTYVAYNSILTAQNPVADIMFIELHPERGFPTQPGVYDLAEVGQGINECQICLFSQENLNVQRRTREHLLMGRSGQIEITAIGDVGEPFRARFIDVQMEEVLIERRGLLNTLYTEYVDNGFVRCADGFEIDVVRQARPAKIGEPVPDFEIMNCSTGEFVGFHEFARDTGAVWIIGTAGWCGACRTLFNSGDMNVRMVPSPLQYAIETPPERARVMIVMGEDRQQLEADRRDCQQYARGYHQRFGQAIDVHFFVDHDGLNGFARLFGHLTTYTSADGRYGLPWNALVEGGPTPIYRYADRSGQPERLGTLLDRYAPQ
ncbi:MAG: hypothetical protein VX589_16070 [Myxococcota bacterium]|nr:hypothetical protein [Myxococcota bacterium]